MADQAKKLLVSFHRPVGFNPGMEVSGCFINSEGKILMLRRHPNKPYGDTWGLPAGKLDSGETPIEAVIREIQEEVGLALNQSRLSFVASLYCQLPHLNYIFHMFYYPFEIKPTILLGIEEHLEARWVTPDEALKLPLIIGGKEAVEIYKNFQSLS